MAGGIKQKTQKVIKAQKDWRVYPPPTLTYKKVDIKTEDIQNRIDRAFDILFQATLKKISTKSN